MRTLTPVPSPARRERGAEGGVRAIEPRAYALGYSLPPLTGLQKTAAHDNDSLNDLLTQDTTVPSLNDFQYADAPAAVDFNPVVWEKSPAAGIGGQTSPSRASSI
ncbi:hypothetical protein SBA2_580006 [Acidobacteriia bacterium SbA2]|nr:hypothetical protein SBA2_580006 [Acidobacteriia bacterium SbA2]